MDRTVVIGDIHGDLDHLDRLLGKLPALDHGDTLVFLGSIATSQGSHNWAFGVGAASASVLWFTGLGYGARLLGPLFAKPIAWRVLDGLIAVVMVTLGVLLIPSH